MMAQWSINPQQKQSQHPLILIDFLKVIVDPFYHGIPNSSSLNHLKQIMVGKCLVDFLELNGRKSNFLGLPKLSQCHPKLPQGYALSWHGVGLRQSLRWWNIDQRNGLHVLVEMIFCFLYHFCGAVFKLMRPFPTKEGFFHLVPWKGRRAMDFPIGADRM